MGTPKNESGFSDGFADFLIKQEADGGAKLKPYKDSNDHWTIGYGHKLGKGGENHPEITEEQALTLLDEDITKAGKRARNSIDKKYGAGTWEGLPPLKKEALADFEFNVGSVATQFPNLTRAIVNDDRLRIGKEFMRWHDHDGDDDQWKKLNRRGEDGNVKEPLRRRNQAWWNKYGKALTGIKYRDTKAVARMVDFLDSMGIPTEDM